jgi:drug/metabolite transporter (DMT)-like permease
MLCSACSFATMGAFAHGLRDRAGWEVIAFVRSLVVLVLSGAMVYAAGVRIHVCRPRALWVRSIAGSLSMLFVFYSLSRLPISIVVTLMNLAPLWVAIASWFLLPHTRSRWVWVVIGIGLVGVLLIQQPQLAQGNLSVLAPLASSFLLALVMLALHRAQRVDTRAVVLHFSVISSLTCLIVFLYAAARAPLLLVADGTTALMLLGTGVAAGLGQLFLTAAFAGGPPAKVAVVGLTQVGFALLYDVVLWGHAFSPLSLAGIALVVTPTGLLLWANRHGLATVILRSQETP